MILRELRANTHTHTQKNMKNIKKIKAGQHLCHFCPANAIAHSLNSEMIIAGNNWSAILLMFYAIIIFYVNEEKKERKTCRK